MTVNENENINLNSDELLIIWKSLDYYHKELRTKFNIKRSDPECRMVEITREKIFGAYLQK